MVLKASTRQMDLPEYHWGAIIVLAQYYGWRPAEPEPDFLLHHSRAVYLDAETAGELSASLEAAMPDIPDEDLLGGWPERPFHQEDNPWEAWSGDKKETLSTFIYFCQRSGFSVTWAKY
jgi:hypothetical protein